MGGVTYWISPGQATVCVKCAPSLLSLGDGVTPGTSCCLETFIKIERNVAGFTRRLVTI